MNRQVLRMAWGLACLILGGCASNDTHHDTSNDSREVTSSEGVGPASGALPSDRAPPPETAGDQVEGLAAYQAQDDLGELIALYPQAQDGDAEAQRLLGVIFATGRGVPADAASARRWLERAARQEDVIAQGLLGRYLNQGRYLAKDTEQAEYWLNRAAANGDPATQFYLASLALDSDAEGADQTAFRWAQAAAEQGHLAAQGTLGWMYLQGVGGQADLMLARRWLGQAARGELAAAQFHLSVLHERLAETPQARAWLQKAAANGHEAARVRLLGRSEYQDEPLGGLSLFGVPLLDAERDLMRQRIVAAGGIVLEQRDDTWVDRYEASRLIEGADRLFASYSLKDGRLAALRYRFPGRNTPTGIKALVDMMEQKYGPPSAPPPYALSGVYQQWRLQKVTVEIGRHGQDALFLRFYLPDRVIALRTERTGNQGEPERQPRLNPY